MKDTITAVSTPPGEGGIGIVRISGPDSVRIASAILRDSKGRPMALTHRRVHYGSVHHPTTGSLIDQVIVAFMKSPHSYTTQDVVEINCHGAPIILHRVMEALTELGVRTARPGEFTQRAFLGGRLDLAQAEGVMDLIRSRTDEARRMAMDQLKGELSRRINNLRDDLMDFLIQLEVRMDFCEEDISPLSGDYKLQKISKIKGQVDELLATFSRGRIYREGLRACILGAPNAGKSTLFNTLLKSERAIVTDIPGTTRDRIEETVNFRGVPLILMDTAGLHHSRDPVESLGIEITRQTARQAGLILLVIDASDPRLDECAEFLSGLDEKKILIVLNKIDLGNACSENRLYGLFPGRPVVEVSLLEGTNLESLTEALGSIILEGNSPEASDVILTNARHREALLRTRQALVSAEESIRNGMADDFITIDLSSALNALGEITGKVLHQDLMERVFENFCIGK